MNMIDQKELEKLGENISKDYVQKNIALNDGLKKVASELGLNKQQLRRVAESANVETYLSLIKTAKDKYLKFDLADANVAHENIVKEGTSSSISNYEIPIREVEISEIFKLYKNAEIPLHDEKMLTEIIEHRNSIPHANGEFKKQSSYLQGVVEYLDTKFMDTQATFNSNIQDLQEQIKQAVLQDTAFEDLATIIKTAAEYTGEVQVELFKSKLSNLTHIDFNKIAEFSSSKPNEESNIYKLANEIETNYLYLTRLEEAHETYRAEYDKLRSDNGVPNMLKHAGFFNMASDTFRWFKSHPKTTAAMVMLASYKAGKMMGTKKQETKIPLTREAINLRLKQYKVR